ncbi:MAG: hypothetical protein QOJ51_7115 [Acidobacteriaceae bacterium]|jgi:hypothetical protein|nr:hypothetical protein [Acidobacteriaceae bacterium]MEA2264290.1 hypothetical protein [Acidobacteriaceae bacterium]
MHISCKSRIHTSRVDAARRRLEFLHFRERRYESFRGSQGLALYQGTTSVVPHRPKTVLGFSPGGLFLAK